jgi:dUTP pyrophosphatase
MTTVRIINQTGGALPSYETIDSAGMDLRAHIHEPIMIGSLERVLVPTGLSIELPEGFEAQIRPRSGLALKKGLTCANSPGTIDADYRGEIKVILVNLDKNPQIIEPNERIAQMIVARYERIEWLETDQLNTTKRGSGGFGSTGVK